MEPLAVPVRVAIAALGVGRTTLYKCIADKRLDALKVGRRTLITVASMKRLIESGGR